MAEPYLEQHRPFLESLFSTFANELAASRPAHPERFLLERLNARCQPATQSSSFDDVRAMQTKAQEQRKRGEWTAVSWVESVGISSAVAHTLVHDCAGSEVDALQRLGDHSLPELIGVLRNGGLVENVAALLQPALHQLAHAEAVATAHAQSKFAGQVEMSFGGLDAFYGGLEAQIGPPQPKVFEGMEAEHLRGPDAEVEWTTANYGLLTTTVAEWRFVVDAEATVHDEAEELLPDRSRCRQPTPLHVFEKASEARNEVLRRAKQPQLTRDEIIGARLYTGPLFEKYNVVMRGLQSGVPVLRRQLVRLCAVPQTLAAYDAACTVGVADGFPTALAATNTYVTTLHVINSAIVKIGRLTMACKVYRGYSGMALPAAFWTPNEFGVVGGVESAFMSCSTERDVAMTYAASRGGIGIVFEVAQVATTHHTTPRHTTPRHATLRHPTPPHPTPPGDMAWSWSSAAGHGRPRRSHRLALAVPA